MKPHPGRRIGDDLSGVSCAYWQITATSGLPHGPNGGGVLLAVRGGWLHPGALLKAMDPKRALWGKD